MYFGRLFAITYDVQWQYCNCTVPDHCLGGCYTYVRTYDMGIVFSSTFN